ncbi:MAG: hypothetical protein NT013_02775 [Planctomycetia bacterium]|nr:hypothetical protein [Planctomycetia bacterium]
MFGSTFSQRLIIVAVLIANAAPLLAQGRGRTNGTVKIGANGLNTQQIQQQLQNIATQLKHAEKPLKEVNDKIAEERRSFQKAELEHKQNIRDLSQAKKLAEEDSKNLPELKAAQKKMTEANDQLSSVRKKVIESLTKDKEEYRTAVKSHEEAVEEQKAQSGVDIAIETRKNLAKKVSDLSLRRKAIEDVAMADNSEAKELTSKLKEATAEVAAASKKKHDLIENDPKTASAKVGFQRTRDALKKAKADLDQAENEHGRIQSQLQALHNQQANLQSQQQLMQKMQGNKGNYNGKR